MRPHQIFQTNVLLQHTGVNSGPTVYCQSLCILAAMTTSADNYRTTTSLSINFWLQTVKHSDRSPARIQLLGSRRSDHIRHIETVCAACAASVSVPLMTSEHLDTSDLDCSLSYLTQSPDIVPVLSLHVLRTCSTQCSTQFINKSYSWHCATTTTEIVRSDLTRHHIN